MNTKLKEAEAELRATLEEYFPKIVKEGKEKRLNKRGADLVLYATAMSWFIKLSERENEWPGRNTIC